MAEKWKNKAEDMGRELRPHVIIEVVKFIGAALAGSSFAKAAYALLTHVNVQWGFLGVMMLVGIVLLTYAYRYNPRPRKDVPISPAKIESFNALAVTRSVLLELFATKADVLCGVLEDIWHQWDNAGEKLIHPIGAKSDMRAFGSDKAIPLIRMVNNFNVLYQDHLNDITEYIADFSSPVLELTYPSQREYHLLMSDLKEHARLLRESCDQSWRARLSTTEVIVP